MNKAEGNYSTIEKECLAIVWAVHEFRHYLIGAHFLLETDHKPLEWLASTKASKSRSQCLERWSLELHAFDFSVVHRPGAENPYALSRHPLQLVTVESSLSPATLVQAQRSDPVLSQVINQIEANQQPQNTEQWRKFPLRRYRQLWHQPELHDSVLYCKIKHPSIAEAKLLIVAPTSLCKKFLHMAHDASGHQGTDKTLARLSDFTYWVGMAREVGNYCTCCTTCQMVKAPATPPAPLQPIVTSRPWEMVAVDILKVPMSSRGNNYLLVAQDYFSKWPFAIALPDQKVTTIVKALRDQVFTMVGPPRRLHSDQGRNFESHILSELCKAFGVEKSHTTPYHPMGDGLVVCKKKQLEVVFPVRLFLHEASSARNDSFSQTEPPNIQQQRCHLIKCCVDKIPHYFSCLNCSPTLTFPDPGDYSSQLQQKLAEMYEMVKANLIESAEVQKSWDRTKQSLLLDKEYS